MVNERYKTKTLGDRSNEVNDYKYGVWKADDSWLRTQFRSGIQIYQISQT